MQPCPAHAQLVIPLNEADLSSHRFGSLHQMAHCILYLRKLITQPEFWGHQGTAVTKVVNTALSCEKIAYWSCLTDSFCIWPGIAKGPSFHSGVRCWRRRVGFLCRVRKKERDRSNVETPFTGSGYHCISAVNFSVQKRASPLTLSYPSSVITW